MLMPRKKAKEEDVLCYEIKTRVNRQRYRVLAELLAQSHHRTMSELVRDILDNRPVTVLVQDESLGRVMEILTGVQQELKAIGTNINQLVHYFHSTSQEHQKVFYALKVSEQYRQVGEKVESLSGIIAQLAQRWLQK